jgi:hypothetical protein
MGGPEMIQGWPKTLQDRCSRLGRSLLGDPVPGCLEFDHRRMLRVAIKEGFEERCADPADAEQESTKNRGRCSGSGAACTLKRSEIHR